MTDAEREAQIRQRQVDRSAVNLNPPSTQQLMQDISDLLRLLDEARAEIARRQEVEDGLVARLASRHEELLRLQSPPGASAMERAALFRKEQLDPWLRDYSITPLAEYEARFDQMFARAIEQAEAQARAKAIETGLEAVSFAHGWIGGLPVTPSFEDKRAAQSALELAEQKLRALAMLIGAEGISMP